MGNDYGGFWGPPRPPEALGILMQSPLILASPEVIDHSF